MNPNNTTTVNEEPETQDVKKGDLEELDPKLKLQFEPFIKYVGEDGLSKIFSKQVLYKEEGLELFMNSFKNIMNDSNINNIINLTLKMVQILLSDKHPQVCIRVIDIFEKLLERIKSSKEKLSYDLNITENVLIRINEKLGDVSQKVRNRSVELYTNILQQKFCDYNNVLIELVKDENIKINVSKTYKVSSSRVILGKLSIFINVFHDFDKAISDKRTELNSFPFLPIATFFTDNIMIQYIYKLFSC